MSRRWLMAQDSPARQLSTQVVLGETYLPDEGRAKHLVLRIFLAVAWAVCSAHILRSPKE